MNPLRGLGLIIVAFLSPISAVVTVVFLAIMSWRAWHKQRYVGTTLPARRTYERHLRQVERELVAEGAAK